ncbi:MAG: MipA/OmpV family protein [Proteobacteria bacterium]|nr:MipA/OmpV family protein [Pseudomonadota bacterium]
MKSLLIIALLGAAAPALAQTATNDPLAKRTVTVAVGAAYIPSYVGSDDYTLAPAVGARGNVGGFNFQFRATQLSVDLVRQSDPHAIDFQLGPVAGVNLNRTRSIKDAQVRALGKLDTAVELGGYVGIGKTGVITSDYDTLSASVTYVHDVASAHGSYRITPSLSYGTPLSRTAYVLVSGYADYVGKDYGDYYYSVSPAGSVASGLAPYSARKSGMLGWGAVGLVNVSLTGDLTGGLSLVAGGGYYRVHGRYAASPIVSVAGDRDQWYGGAGLAYTF